MPYREKRIYSGAMLEIERVHCTSCGRIIGRRPRGLPTGKAQARINLRNAQLKLARLMCENFCRGDYHITLTFSQTMTREQQAEALAKLLRWLRRACRKAGGGRYADGDLRYICVREDRGVRPHYHLVCQAFGLMVDELAEAWPWGRVEMGTLDGCPDYGWLARYLTKQEDQDKGRKRWSQSKNLRPPYMPEPKILKRKALSYRPKVPKDYYALTHYRNATAGGYEWEYIICIRKDRKQELPLDIQEQLDQAGCWSAYTEDMEQTGL